VDILFFSRGRGRGHAIPDAAIMDEVAAIRSNLDWSFASYATGAKTLQALGYDIHDLDLPEENPFLATTIGSYRLMEKFKPRFIVAHEEPAALLAAELLQVPAAFITEWFVADTTLVMQPLSYAKSIIVIQHQGIFDEPSYAKDKVQYMGPMMRKMLYTKEDRNRARQELKLNKEAIVIACLPGGWATEAREPVADLLLTAFDGVRGTEKKLVWVAGSDRENLINQTAHRNDVIIVNQVWPIEQLMVASDLVIAKANRGTIMEAAYLGIPSISLSHGLNPIDDYIVRGISLNHPLRMKGLTAEHLTICMENLLNNSTNAHVANSFAVSSANDVALALIKGLGL
jgi:UDP-N-acetylglucosamine:LPS N-acetylglucosamine transferase